MRRLIAVVASGLLLGGVVLTSPAAWADHGSSGGLDDFNLTGEFTDFEKDDTGEEGPSEGDTFTVTMDLFDEHGEEAGDGEGTCEATEVDHDAHKFTADCEGIFHLEEGNLAMSGEITEEDHEDGEIVMDIDGDNSSDIYEGSAGTVTFTRADEEGETAEGGEGGHNHAMSAGSPAHGPGGDEPPDEPPAEGHDEGHDKGHHKMDIAVDFD
ncbi:MAG: allene oxide cyclase barrel-like domain-containing protein [Acidimicrobiia bacterium]